MTIHHTDKNIFENVVSMIKCAQISSPLSGECILGESHLIYIIIMMEFIPLSRKRPDNNKLFPEIYDLRTQTSSFF